MSTPIGNAPASSDPLLAPPTGFPETPLLRDELPPLRPPMLDISPTSKRMENLDAMRILCMLVIIVTHVSEPYLDSIHKYQTGFTPLALAVLAVNVMGRFGVPCFMMISFFIYWHQLYEKNRSWGELLARRLKRLVPAFLVWSAVYFVIHRQLYKKFGNAEFYNPLNAFSYSIFKWQTWWGLLMGRAEYHLYYLPLVMQCLLCIPLLKILCKRPAISWLWIGGTSLAWALMVYGPVLFPPGSSPRHATDLITKIMYQPWAIPFLIFPLFGMMCAGQSAARNFIAHTPMALWVALLIAGLALHSMEAIYLARKTPDDMLRIAAFVKTGRIVTAFAVFALFLRHPLMRDPFPQVSHYAFGLHFMHPAIILIISLVELKLFPHAFHWQTNILLTLTINLLLTFTLTFSLCLLLGRIKKLEFLVV